MSESKEQLVVDHIAKHEPVTGKKCEYERYCYRLAEFTILGSSNKRVCNFHHYLITAKIPPSTPAKKE